MTKDEILNLAECSAEELKENGINTDIDIVGYIIFETNFLYNWAVNNIKNYLPDCMTVYNYSNPINIIDRYEYPRGYSDERIIQSLLEGKNIITNSMAVDMLWAFPKNWGKLIDDDLLSDIKETIYGCFEITHLL